MVGPFLETVHILELVNVRLIWKKKVFADVLQLRILK